MGIRVFPIIEGEDKNRYYAGYGEWKCLSDCVSNGVVLFAAQQMNVIPISGFQTGNRQDAVDSMGIEEVEEYEAAAEVRADGLYIDGMLLWSTERSWFEPESGLATVRALLDWMLVHPEVPEPCEPSNPNLYLTGAESA